MNSIDENVTESVIRSYADCKAAGHGEMAARNAAIVALREALPSWDFRAASETVSRILEVSSPAGQAA